MQIYSKIHIILCFLILTSCSASYKKLQNSSFNPKSELSKYLLEEYKKKAVFEAEEMHDWNSAKLYSEKALKAANEEEVLPQKISFWKISSNNNYQIQKGYNNLMIIYQKAVLLDPSNLAKAISSLDCWAEQQEEKWQTWDINKCRDDFLKAMHMMYEVIKKDNEKIEKNKLNSTFEKNQKEKNYTSIITKSKNEDVMQIIYFDFDKFQLSSVSKNEIKKFINKNKKIINKYIVVGHTDTMGSKKYNLKLSIDRAKSVKNMLIELGVESGSIKIFGKGEEELSIKTNDEVSNPINRRAEISLLN